MSTQNTRAVPIRAIIMILLSLAIIFAAVGVHGFSTRNDDPNAALNAQEAKLQAAATETTAPASEAKPAVCLISVNRAPVADASEKLTKAGYPLAEGTAAWPGRPAAPRATTVYFGDGGEAAAKAVSEELPGSAVAARPGSLEPCADQIAVAVVRK